MGFVHGLRALPSKNVERPEAVLSTGSSTLSLRVLIALVTLILVGTGLSVQSYLHATEAYGAPPAAETPDACRPCPGQEPDEAAPDELQTDELPEARRLSGGALESAASTSARPGSGWVRCPEPSAG